MAIEESVSKLADAILVLASAIDRSTKAAGGAAPAPAPAEVKAEKPKVQKQNVEKTTPTPDKQPGTTPPTRDDAASASALTYEKDLKPALLGIGDTEKIREFLKTHKYESGPAIPVEDYAKVIAAAKTFGAQPASAALL